MNDKSCTTCEVLRQVCTHDPSVTTIQCWQGMHSKRCSSFCECDCHLGSFPLDRPRPVTQDEVDAAIASIKEAAR